MVLCFKNTSSYSAQNGVLWIGRSRIPWLGSLDGKGIPGGAFSGLFEPFGNESHGLKNLLLFGLLYSLCSTIAMGGAYDLAWLSSPNLWEITILACCYDVEEEKWPPRHR